MHPKPSKHIPVKINTHLWSDSCVSTESTLHQIAPYIGKMKSSMARNLINSFTKRGDIICDPFVGSGVIALEGVISGREIIASDINPYAIVLTKAKLNPPLTVNDALDRATFYLEKIKIAASDIRLGGIPKWVKSFYHPKTLREIIAICNLLKRNREYFLLACLVGILHHQRPGFLSYPASHLVPYLRSNKYPKEEFPEMYKYRDVNSRLLKKILRVYKRFPEIDRDLTRTCRRKNALNLDLPKSSIDAVITSPPYMNALDYARDNRLRLWFLGVNNFESYDNKNPDNCIEFINLMEICLNNINNCLRKKGYCILVIGEVNRSSRSINTAQMISAAIKNKISGFKLEQVVEDAIPDIRRSRKNGSCTKKEWILVYRKG